MDELISTSQLRERYGRPDFIPREVFRQWVTTTRLNQLMEIDGISAGSYIKRWVGKSNAIKRSGNLYRPIDLFARARNQMHEVRPPKTERTRLALHEIERRYEQLRKATEDLPHQVQMHEMSTGLTSRRLLTEKEIVGNGRLTPHLTGVYFLIKDEKIVYVGQSLNIISRVAAHVNHKEFDRFAFVPCEKDGLNVLESLYIHFLQPELNGMLNGDNGHHAPLRLTQLSALHREIKEHEDACD